MTEFKTQKDSPLPQDPQDESPEERQRFDADMKVKMEENFRDTREDLESLDDNVTAIETIQSSRVRVTKNDAQSMANNAYTKIEYDDVEEDNLSEYDAVTNYRFTGKNPGWYWVNASALLNSAAWAAGERVQLHLYKNGAAIRTLGYDAQQTLSTRYRKVHGSTLVYLNGTTDYITIVLYHNQGAAVNLFTAAVQNYLEIHRLS